MSTLQSKNTAFARVEFLAHREMVLSLLASGYTCRAIYSHLFEQGKITMSYRSFLRYASGKGNKKHSVSGFNPPVEHAEESSDQFSHNREITQQMKQRLLGKD